MRRHRPSGSEKCRHKHILRALWRRSRQQELHEKNKRAHSPVSNRKQHTVSRAESILFLPHHLSMGAESFTLRPSRFTSSCDVPRYLPMKRVCRRRCKEPEHGQDVRLSSQSSGRKLFHVKQGLLHPIAPKVPASFVLAASVSCSRQQHAEGICQQKIFQRPRPGPCDA